MHLSQLPKFFIGFHSNTSLRSYSNQSTFEKITSYETLVASISNASSFTELVNIATENASIIKNEHIILTLRMFSRLIKGNPSEELQELVKDDKFKRLVQQAEESIDKLTEYGICDLFISSECIIGLEILDLLFTVRKFRSNRLYIDFKEENLSYLLTKINEFVRAKAYNFRNLAVIYNDLSYLNRFRGEVVNELINEIKHDARILSKGPVILLLKGLSQNNGHLGQKEYYLLDLIIKNFSEVLEELDIDEKAQVLKLLASLNLQNCPPRYRSPYLLNTIRARMKDNFDTLSEKGVVFIIQAYKHLPIEFPLDLLNSVKEMVTVIVQHASSQLSSHFLLEFLLNTSELRRSRRLNDKQLNILLDEIAKRINDTDFLGKFNSFVKIMTVLYIHKTHSEPVINSILEKFSKTHEGYYHAATFELLALLKADITPLVDKVIALNPLEKLDLKSLTSFYVLLTYLKNPKYDELEHQILEKMMREPDVYKIGQKVATSYIKNKKTTDFIIKALHDLDAKYGQLSDFEFFNFYIEMISFGTMETALEIFKKHLDEFGSSKLPSLLEMFARSGEITIEKLLFLTQALETVNDDSLPLRKLMRILNEIDDFSSLNSRGVHALSTYFRILSQNFDKMYEEVKFQNLYVLSLKADSAGVKIPILKTLLKNYFSRMLESGLQGYELSYVEYMVNNSLVSPSDLRKIYNLFRNNTRDIDLRIKILNDLVLSDPNAATEKEIQQELKQLFSSQQAKLKESDQRNKPNVLATLLTFPPQLISENKDNLLKALTETLTAVNSSQYVALVQSIPIKNARPYFSLYSVFLRELSKNYPRFGKRLRNGEIILILEKFSSLYYGNIPLYNAILADLLANFEPLHPEDCTRIIHACSIIGITHEDLLDKIFDRLFTYPLAYRDVMKQILGAAFKIGFVNQNIRNNLLKFIEANKSERQENLVALIQYLPILEFENERELLEALFSRIITDSKRGYFKNLTQYFKAVYPDKPEYAEAIQKISFENVDTEAKYADAIERVADYLKVMNIEYQENVELKGVIAPIVIPAQKIIIQPLESKDIGIDFRNIRGHMILKRKSLETVAPGYKIVLLNMIEFKRLNNQKKIEFLKAAGIEGSSPTGSYDFTSIDSRSEYQDAPDDSAFPDKEDYLDHEELEDDGDFEKDMR